MEERIQKLLSRCGLASRRQAEQMIEAGRVRVNGNTARLGDTADLSQDVVELDGVPLRKAPPKTYILLHKPRGYVTTLHDERGRKQVSELVADCGERVYPVGRLDQFSEGLLLMTNDGDLANRLTHPKHDVEKVYLVWVSGYRPGAGDLVKRPIEIDGRRTRPAKVTLRWQKDRTALLEVVISEGRNRQIRRLCQAADLTVTRLKRIREGPLTLGDLPVGTWRYLTQEEVEALRCTAGNKR